MGVSSGKTALITGATSGIGLEFAKLFARDGYNLIIVAQHERALAEVAAQLEGQYSVSCTRIACDLSKPQAANTIHHALQQAHHRVDILINNAGFGTWGSFSTSDLDLEIAEIQLNIVTLAKLTRFLLPDMIHRKSGRILNVASTAAFAPGPFMATYYATKAFVFSFTQALREELRGSGVSVSVLCPGETSTAFQRRAGIADTNLTRPAFIMKASTVARRGYTGLMKGRPMIIPGLRNKFLIFCTRILPRVLISAIVRWFNSHRDNVQSSLKPE